MKLLVIFTLALSASAYQGYHNEQRGNQQHVEYTYLDSHARSHCARGGKQLCATNGKEYVLFENACQLEAQNLKRLFVGESDLVETSLHYCKSDYNDYSYPATKPTGSYTSASAQNAVCASFQNQQKTFDDLFALHEESSATGNDWQFVSFGPCKRTSSYPETSLSYLSHQHSAPRSKEAFSNAYATPNFKLSYSKPAETKPHYYEDVHPAPYYPTTSSYQANVQHKAVDELYDYALSIAPKSNHYKPLEYQSLSHKPAVYQAAATPRYHKPTHRQNYDYLFDFPQPIAAKTEYYKPDRYQTPAAVPSYQSPSHYKTLVDLFDFPAPPKPRFYEPLTHSGTSYQPATYQPIPAFHSPPPHYYPSVPFISSLEHVAPYYPPPAPAVYTEDTIYPHIPSHPYAYTYKANGTVAAFASASYNDHSYYAKNTTLAPPTTTTTELTMTEPTTTESSAIETSTEA